MVQQHVDDVPEAVWILGREETTADLVHGLFQLRKAVVVLSGIVPVGKWGISLWGEPHAGCLYWAQPWSEIAPASRLKRCGDPQRQ